MIQENNLHSNSNNQYYDQSNQSFSTTLPSMPLNRIEDHSLSLLNGECITMDIQQQPEQNIIAATVAEQYHNQQQHDSSLQTLQQLQFFETYLYQEQQQQTLNQEQQEQQIQMFLHTNSRISSFNNAACPPEETPPKDLTTHAMNEVSNETSDTSTIEDEVTASQDRFAYLSELNSDNLMQFSQQSILQEMLIKEQFQGKPNLHILPTVEEHDIGGFNFKLSTSTQHSKGKTSWKFSEDLNKLYIRMNDTFTVDAVYTPKFPIQPLRLRTFICFVKEVSEPVSRCQNHLSKDTETNNIKRESVLRCDNPDAEYCGSAEGNSIKERFSVVIPLSAGITQNDKSVKQTIAFKFTCQNSCIGRKETCLMFLLEGVNGEILSQRILNVRICTCPKRDKSHDEKSTKRKADGDIFQRDVKIARNDLSLPASPIIKDENSCSDYEPGAAKQFDLQPTASGGFRLVIELSSKDVALSTIDYALSKESANIVQETHDAPRSRRNVRKLKRLYDISAEFN